MFFNQVWWIYYHDLKSIPLQIDQFKCTLSCSLSWTETLVASHPMHSASLGAMLGKNQSINLWWGPSHNQCVSRTQSSISQVSDAGVASFMLALMWVLSFYIVQAYFTFLCSMKFRTGVMTLLLVFSEYICDSIIEIIIILKDK